MVHSDLCRELYILKIRTEKEFREKLYGQILEVYDRAKDHVKGAKSEEVVEMPEFSVSVTPFEREGSDIRGLARIFFEDGFLVNNVTILQRKDKKAKRIFEMV